MSINNVRDGRGRARLQFEFSRSIGGKLCRTRKLLPIAFTRAQADAYDRKESARIYARATGTEQRVHTIDEAVVFYIRERSHDLKTGRAITAEIRSLEEYWKGRPLHELPEVAAAITEDYTDDVAPATLNNKLRYLASACRWGWKKHKLCEHDPADRIIWPTVRNERQVYVDEATLLHLAAACDDRAGRAAMRIAFYSGMRLGEIERAERIYALRAFLLTDTKNGDPRMVPMHEAIVEDAAVPLGTRYQTGYQFRKACAIIGRADLHFHDLRHSFASAALLAGAELYSVGKVLGHRSPTSTKRYAHLALEGLRGVVSRVGTPTFTPLPPADDGVIWPELPMEARAGVEPTYSDLQSGA